MPVYVYDPDALEKLTSLEGERWAEDAARYFRDNKPGETGRGYLYEDFKYAWDKYHEEYGDYWKAACASFEELRLEVIYGVGGYSRYLVSSDGEIVLLGWSVDRTPEKVAARKALGFRVML